MERYPRVVSSIPEDEKIQVFKNDGTKVWEGTDTQLAADLARLAEYDAKIGRMVELPEFKDEQHDGLKVKYRVFKARNGEPVENCFVLRPDKDIVAKAALFAYAINTRNEDLKSDILVWLSALAAQEGEKE